MSLAVFCSQCFALRVSKMLSLIIDTPTPPYEKDDWLTNSPTT